MKIYPTKSVLITIASIQLRRFCIQLIQLAGAITQFSMRSFLQQKPIDLIVLAPFLPLCKLRTHEHQFFARMDTHVGKAQAEIGALLPIITRHFANQGSLAVYDLIVRDR